jgi:hypothetical protein
VEALGGERVTKKKIDALIDADVGEVLKFALGGEVDYVDEIARLRAPSA